MSEVKPDWESPYFYQELSFYLWVVRQSLCEGNSPNQREVGGGFENKQHSQDGKYITFLDKAFGNYYDFSCSRF